MNSQLTESYLVEQASINWFKEIGYEHVYGGYITPDNNERESYKDVILKNRFIKAIKKINPWIKEEQIEDVYKKVKHLNHPDFLVKGKIFYDFLVKGVKISFLENGKEKVEIVKLIDFEDPNNNEFLVSNQFKVENHYVKDAYRVPDMVVFINGLPLSVFEFKNFNASETAKDAFNDHKVKMKDIPQLYVYSQVICVSDGLETKYGSPTSDWERFFVWEGIESDDDLELIKIDETHYKYKKQNKTYTSCEVLIKGLFDKVRFLDYIKSYIVFEQKREGYIKKIAVYYQFYAVQKAIEKTIFCITKAKKSEDRRIGVIWHTQGTGKSLTMYFYAKKVLELLGSPLIIVITDRNELDEQLYKVFSGLLIAKRTETIKDLQTSIVETTTGIIFATIQKFSLKQNMEEYPLLSERKDIVVIVDEAHRSQYRELARNLRKAIPNASFIGFTATPIELSDRNTYLVFGEPLSIYSMDKARRHNVVVPIYYEARLPELHLTNEFIDEEYEQISEEILLDPDVAESLKRKFANIEKIMLSDDYLEKIAKDIVEHYNNRCEILKGKALIVTISRKVAAKLYQKMKMIDKNLEVVVVFSGSKQDDPEFVAHIRNKQELEEVANKFKDPESFPNIAIVVDMWLTGFDVPCLHTMYFIKPMKNHSLVQALARVNRVFKDKPGGLVVDYVGIFDDLRKSLAMYALKTDVDNVISDIKVVINKMIEKHKVVCGYFTGIDFSNWNNLTPEELQLLTVEAYEKIAVSKQLQRDFLKNFIALKKLFALASPAEETFRIKNDILFFEMIKKMLVKYSSVIIKEAVKDLENEITELISKSISAEEPVDVYEILKKEKPDISVLDEKFLEKFKNLKYKNYTAEVLIKLLNDEIKVRFGKNPIRYRSLKELLEKLIDKYNTKVIDTTEILAELIKIAEEIKNKDNDKKKIGLSESELLFYDILLQEKEFVGKEEYIKKIAKKISDKIGPFVKVVDWEKKERVRSQIRKLVKEILLEELFNIKYEKADEIASVIESTLVEVYQYSYT